MSHPASGRSCRNWPAAKAASPAPKPAAPKPAPKASAPVALERERKVLPDDERLPAAAAAAPATDVTWSDAMATDPADEILGDLESDAVEDDEDEEFGAGGGDDDEWK